MCQHRFALMTNGHFLGGVLQYGTTTRENATVWGELNGLDLDLVKDSGSKGLRFDSDV